VETARTQTQGSRRPAERAGDWRFAALAAAIVVVSAWLRFHRLGEYELWLDEAFTFELAASSDFGDALLRENSPPLYYLLQRLWLGAFGASEVALRSLAASCGVLFVGVLIATGRRVLGLAGGLWAGAIAALAPLHVYYSQEMRPYSLLMLALLLAFLTLWRAVASGSARAWVAFGASACLALSTHYFAILALAPAALLPWLAPAGAERRRRMTRFAVAAAVAAVPCGLWLTWSFFGVPHPQQSHAWIQRIWENLPPALAVPRSLEVLLLGSQLNLLPGFFKQFTLLTYPAWLRALGLALLLVLGATALLPWGDRRLGIAQLGRRRAWLCALTLLPLAALFAISLLRPYYVVGRYDVVAFPGFVLLLGLGMAKLQRLPRFGPLLALLVGAALFGVLAAKLTRYYDAAGQTAGPSARATARALQAGLRDGDVVFFTPGRGMSVSYYLGRLGYRREGWSCENAATGRRFVCANVPFDDEGMVLDLDHLDRVAFSPEVLRSDARAAMSRADPARNSVWIERRVGPPAWLAAEAIIADEAGRAGFERGTAPAALRNLRLWVYRATR